MAIDILLLAAAVAFFFLTGMVVLGLIDWKGRVSAGFVVGMALAFMIGLGAVSMQLLLYAMIGIQPYRLPFIVLPWVIAYILMVRIRPGALPRPRAGWFKEFLRHIGIFESILLAIIAAQVVYAFTAAALIPPTAWDAWQTWFFKARVFFMDMGIRPEFFSNIESHPDYPLLVPLSAAWVYMVTGKANELLADVIYPIQFLSMIIIFYYFVKKASSARAALLFTTLLSITPMIIVHAGGLPTNIGTLANGDSIGYADFPLSIYFMAAGGFLYLYTQEDKREYLVISAVFLGMGAWTKKEGLPFAVAGMAVMAAHILLERKRLWKEMWTALASVLIIAVPWQLYVAIHKIPADSMYAGRLTLHSIISYYANLSQTADSFMFFMFEDVALFNFTWYAYALAVLIGWRRFFSRPILYLNVMVFMQIAAYSLAYTITTLDLDFHLRTSLDRVVLHLLPLSFLVVALVFGQRFSGNPAP